MRKIKERNIIMPLLFPDGFLLLPIECQRNILVNVILSLPECQAKELYEMIESELAKMRNIK